MLAWMRFTVFEQTELKFMWWQRVFDDPCKSFDNCQNQILAFKRVVMN